MWNAINDSCLAEYKLHMISKEETEMEKKKPSVIFGCSKLSKVSKLRFIHPSEGSLTDLLDLRSLRPVTDESIIILHPAWWWRSNSYQLLRCAPFSTQDQPRAVIHFWLLTMFFSSCFDCCTCHLVLYFSVCNFMKQKTYRKWTINNQTVQFPPVSRHIQNCLSSLSKAASHHQQSWWERPQILLAWFGWGEGGVALQSDLVNAEWGEKVLGTASHTQLCLKHVCVCVCL